MLHAGCSIVMRESGTNTITRQAGLVFCMLMSALALRANADTNPDDSTMISLPISSESLIAYYPLDGNARDLGSHNLHGVPFGASPTRDRHGHPAGALYFDGVDDYIDLGNSKRLKPQPPFSVCAWVTFERFWGEWFFTNNYDEDYYNGFWLGAGVGGIGQPIASFGNGGLTTPLGGRSFFGQDTLQLHNWYFFTAIFYSTEKIDLVIDGKPVKGNYSGFGSSLTYSDGPALMGKKDTNYDAPPWYFKGAVDELYFLALREIEWKRV
ncbi:MAG: LamG domain-containing protein [Lentisphaeria bacterium]|nr:LamG domain-containing protein [Candidatus Neomarinimicrobiota bacterium]MCF7842072.1 LamG domain-containing protein [Lentisphaeria bacterium]